MLLNRAEKMAIKVYVPLFVVLTAVIVSVIVVYTKADQKEKLYTDKSNLWGMQINQSIYGGNGEEVAKKAKAELDRLHRKISYKVEGSDIKKINDGAGERWIRCDEDTIKLIDRAIEICNSNKGIFDITILKLTDLWGFEKKHKSVPDATEIDKALTNIGYNQIKINRDVDRIKIDNNYSGINLNQIERGIACEKIINTYKEMGIDYAISSVDGVVGVYGNKPDQPFWKISVKESADEQEDSVIGFIKVSDGYVSTLGGNENKILIGEKIYNKVINLQTGYPAENSIDSITILHFDAMVANALSYMCFTTDKIKAEELIGNYGAEGVFIYNDKGVYVTPGLRENFSLINNDYKLLY